MPRIFTQPVRNTIFRTTLGVELRTWMWQEIALHLASSTTSTSMCFQEGPSLIRRKSQIRLKCMTSTTTCGEWLTWMPRVPGQPATSQCACQLIPSTFLFLVVLIRLKEPRNVSNSTLRQIWWSVTHIFLRLGPSLIMCSTTTTTCMLLAGTTTTKTCICTICWRTHGELSPNSEFDCN